MSGRPTVPISSDLPVKGATPRPSSARTQEVWCEVCLGVAIARSTTPSSLDAVG